MQRIGGVRGCAGVVSVLEYELTVDVLFFCVSCFFFGRAVSFLSPLVSSYSIGVNEGRYVFLVAPFCCVSCLVFLVVLLFDFSHVWEKGLFLPLSLNLTLELNSPLQPRQPFNLPPLCFLSLYSSCPFLPLCFSQFGSLFSFVGTPT